jgi:peroxiredoxin
MLALFISHQMYSQGCFQKCRDHLSAPLRSNENLEMRFEQSANVLQALVGCRAPEFNVTTIKGESINSKALRGKVIVVNFWFQSCEPCLKELPALNKLTGEYKGRDVVFIAFSRDTESQINKFLVDKTFNFQIVSNKYNVSEDFCVIGGWPMHLIIDKKGIVQFIKAGGVSKDVSPRPLTDQMKVVIDENLIEAAAK